MPSVNGSLKTKELRLQGSSDAPDFTLKVESDELNIKRGDATLLSISQDDEAVLSGDVTGTDKISISAQVTFEQDVTLKSSLTLGNTLLNEAKLQEIIKDALTSKTIHVPVKHIYEYSDKMYDGGIQYNAFTENSEEFEIDINTFDASQQNPANISNAVKEDDGTFKPFKAVVNYGTDRSDLSFTVDSVKESTKIAVQQFFERGHDCRIFEFDNKVYQNMFENLSVILQHVGNDMLVHVSEIEDKRIPRSFSWAPVEQRTDFKYYPMKLPLTTNASDFHDGTDVAYFDEATKVLHLKAQSTHVMTNSHMSKTLGVVDFEFKRQLSVSNFSVSYASLKRSSRNKTQVGPCNMDESDVFVQVSDLKFDYTRDGVSGQHHLALYTDGAYSGMPVPLATNALQINVAYTDQLNFAFASTVPSISDNLYTTTTEEKASKKVIFCADNGYWQDRLIYHVNPERFDNPGTPEEMGSIWQPGDITKEKGSTVKIKNESGDLVDKPFDLVVTHNAIAHEYAHVLQSTDLYVYETQAEGLSYDPAISLGSVLAWSSGSRHNFLCKLYRGAISISENSKENSIPASEIANTDANVSAWTAFDQYGGGLFYVWLSDQIDTQQQFMRLERC